MGRGWVYRRGEERAAKGNKETFGGNRAVHYLDHGDVFHVCTYITTYQTLHFTHVKCLYFNYIPI